MKSLSTSITALMALVLLGNGGCVTSGTHQAVVNELAKTRTTLASTQKQLKESNDKLTTALDQNQQLVTKISAMGQNVEQLLGEKGTLSQERAKLEAEHNALAKEVDELKRMRAAAEARNAEYRAVLDKLRRMIDAGTLQVKFRGGRMLVQMSSDVVFPPGGIRIKPDAKEAITELAETIKQFPDRKFQIIGHSDSTPIHTDRFPSNWELSTQRAIEVVRLMIDAGVPPEMLSAAGAAEFDPIAPNDTEENKAMNRRVEIVFLPKLDELPGFDNVK
jgi:chemotaxis protein MotB